MRERKTYFWCSVGTLEVLSAYSSDLFPSSDSFDINGLCGICNSRVVSYLLSDIAIRDKKAVHTSVVRTTRAS